MREIFFEILRTVLGGWLGAFLYVAWREKRRRKAERLASEALDPPSPSSPPPILIPAPPKPPSDCWKVIFDVLHDGGLVITFDPQLAPNKGTLVTYPLIARFTPTIGVEYARRIIAAHETSAASEKAPVAP